MTIKRTWIDEKGIAQEKVLKSGHSEKIIWMRTDPIETKITHFIDARVKVVTDDMLEFRHRRGDSIRGEGVDYKILIGGELVELQSDWKQTLTG